MNIQTDSQLVREALVREIRDATRWSAVIEAWQALLSVRRKADALIEEQKPANTMEHAKAVEYAKAKLRGDR